MSHRTDPMDRIEDLLRNNQAFVESHLRLDPGYFEKLAAGQHPQCKDTHGWVFDLHTGRIHPQTGSIENNVGLREVCKFASGLIGH
jgi:carbonic anhydrase